MVEDGQFSTSIRPWSVRLNEPQKREGAFGVPTENLTNNKCCAPLGLVFVHFFLSVSSRNLIRKVVSHHGYVCFYLLMPQALILCKEGCGCAEFYVVQISDTLRNMATPAAQLLLAWGYTQTYRKRHGQGKNRSVKYPKQKCPIFSLN